MQTWYECRVKSLKIDENGYERRVNEPYLLDAVSYSDAEYRINALMTTLVKGGFQVVSIKQSNITEILQISEGEWWWKVKISLATIDEESGREKKLTNYLLISADNIASAVVNTNEGLNYMLVPYFIEQISLSSIVDVFPYSEFDRLGISENGMKRKAEEESEE